MPTCKLFFHDACFDGTASAALFSAFYRGHAPGTEVVALGVGHKLGDAFADVAIDGDDNACVDFRYTDHPAMRWWFDHHATAFQPASLRAHFAERRELEVAYDPTAPSCAGLVLRTLEARFGWQPPPHLVELAACADVVDAAAYPDAAAACSLATPAARLAVWVATVRDAALYRRYIAALVDTPLAEIDQASWVRASLDPILARRAADRRRWTELGEVRDHVVVFDLIGRGVGSPGLTAYALFPQCTYTITVLATDSAVKVGVGWNPWGGPRLHDVGALCAAHGGGGHAVVGGVTLPPGQIAHGRAVAAAIARSLTAPRAGS